MIQNKDDIVFWYEKMQWDFGNKESLPYMTFSLILTEKPHGVHKMQLANTKNINIKNISKRINLFKEFQSRIELKPGYMEKSSLKSAGLRKKSKAGKVGIRNGSNDKFEWSFLC